ncbi:MAG: radical SAM/SPASM domain-containing protein [Promethearchaeota archaeon]
MAKTILRNEPFGAVYFNQATGRMVMVDTDGFFTLLKFLKEDRLTEKEQKFASFFFNDMTPQKIELRIDRSIKPTNNYFIPITKTPVLIDLSLNNYCNLYCEYCYMSAKPIPKGSHLSMDDFKVILDQMRKAKVLQIALGGGEPTLHPHFVEILTKLRLEGDIIPNYTTNGSHLTEEILNATKQHCGAVAVSYSKKREKETKSAVKKFLSYGIQTNMHLVLLKSRIPRLAQITEHYAQLGISNIVLLLFKPMGRGAALTNEILTAADFRILARELLKILTLRKKYGLRLSIDACSSFIVKDFPFLPQSIECCTGALTSAYIDWNLNMKPCSFMQEIPGVDLTHYNIIDAWYSPLFERFRQTLLHPRYQGCISCQHFVSCLSGCPITPKIVFCESKGSELDLEVRI